MKRRLLNLDLILVLGVFLIFVGGFFFVVYEADEEPTQNSAAVIDGNRPQDRESSASLGSKSVLQPNVEVNISGTEPGPLGEIALNEKSYPAALKGSAENVSLSTLGTSDFGIDGAVFSLVSGLPLAGCEVNFLGQRVTTNASGEFDFWHEGGVGALSFSCAGAQKLQIRKFDISAGDGLAHFDVYIDESDNGEAGRIEVNGVSGRVYSRESGAPLAGGKISLGNLRGVTDAAGFFELWGSDTALLTMTISAHGYISEMISGIDFDNQTNPFFYEVALEREVSGSGRKRLALVGIGARLVRSEAGFEIADLLDGSPAAHEGLTPGDRLVAVDSLAVDDFSLREVVEMIRGQIGQPVTLMVERDDEIMEFICVRERVIY
ncbi:PDZ domain-containing protein [bacterium]|nr:PDZ domain-containing protein [bacterium]